MKRYENVRVLIVEDEYLTGKMIKGTLERMGHIVVGEAEDGLKAIELARQLQPDVILMDLSMPNMDGITATRKIQQECPTPVVVLTGLESPGLLEEVSEAGAGAYLVKPPHALEMGRAIAIAMARFQDLMELRRLNAVLKARNVELDQFSMSVAHALKTPLTPVKACAEILHQEIDQIPASLHDFVLLKLARVRREDLELKPLDMAEIVAAAWLQLALAIEESQAELILPDSWPVAQGYAPWVEEVWVNYMSNALKYGGRPPRLELGAESGRDGLVRFWVQDNGRGLSTEEQSQLFMPFKRLKREEEREVEGHGLGLATVHRMVEKLEGEVGVVSNGVVGQGSRFFFSLPLA